MKLNHFHLCVKDYTTAIEWLENIWQLKPVYQDEKMAAFEFGDVTLILDAMEMDSFATLGFETDDCDRDFKILIERGAEPVDEPEYRPWGVRSAYIKGPGKLQFELEQKLT